ncbi:MAG: dCTP deaminase [Anaerolineae bacterium]|nr:dCTP deaminase [Anaerolineae bacterium]
MVLSDHEIAERAARDGMIQPFVETQIKRVGNVGVVSFGLSSYGYDFRVANEFKVFKTTFMPVIDPKHFVPTSFDEVVAADHEAVIIPPNSFALARTVETFHIPRDVLAIVIGKSTYARCFAGDTRVALVDGTAPTLEEMATRAQGGELFWGYSIGSHGRLIVTLLEAPRYIGRDVLVAVDLDSGASIECTPDHQFLLRDGRMREAAALRPGDALMPLYRQAARGYEMVYQPLNGHLYPTHRLADEWNLHHLVYEDAPGTHRHHVDLDRRNNKPTNITRMDASEHIRLHNDDTYGVDFDPDEHGAAIQAAFERLRQDPAWAERLSQAQQARAEQFWHADRYDAIRQRVLEARRNPDEETRQAHREAMLRRFSDPAARERQSRMMTSAWSRASAERHTQQAEIARRLRTRAGITAETVRAALDETGSIRGAARLLGCDRSVFHRFPEVLAAFRGQRQPKNHRVAAIRDLPGVHDVYCLAVPEAGNFALEAGVFVHNCGIIINITPLEPEWEGEVTIEISNTTPLPALIYAGEGIGQVLFLRGSEVCETSYADKAGKYMRQQGIVLPRL